MVCYGMLWYVMVFSGVVNCLCAMYVDRNQRSFLAQMTSFVVQYDVTYHSFHIN